MKKFNNEWWIGRPVKEDGVVGFVPSPVNLETILIRREVQARKAAKALAKYAHHGCSAGDPKSPLKTVHFLFPIEKSIDWSSKHIYQMYRFLKSKPFIFLYSVDLH